MPRIQSSVRALPVRTWPVDVAETKPREPDSRTIAGRICSMRRIALLRHVRQERRIERVALLYEKTRAGGHIDRVTLMSRQPRSCATRRTAGNHVRAWLSPNNTIVVLERMLP